MKLLFINDSFGFAAVPELLYNLLSPFYSTCSYLFLQTKWSQPCDQYTFPLTFSSQHLLVDSQGFLQVIWLEKYSASVLPQAPGTTSTCLSFNSHSFFKPTYSSAGSHGAGSLSQQALGGRMDTLLMQSNTQFHTYWQSIIIYFYHHIDAQLYKCMLVPGRCKILWPAKVLSVG